MANTTDEPAVLAHQCYLNKDYTSALQHLNELENLVGNNSVLLKRIQHNKAIVELAASDMKNVTKFKSALSDCTGVSFPDEDIKETASPFAIYNYAVVLYHSRYYYQSATILEKLLALKLIKDKKLLRQVVLLLLECTLCRRTYDKTLEIAKTQGDGLKSNNEVSDLYQRLVSRAQIFLGQKIQLKADSIENVCIIAQEQYLNGNINEAANTLGLYRTLQYNYDVRSEGEDIWATINNNLGVIFLSIKKPYIATKYFQNALKEHFKTMESEDSERLIVSKDRPIYVYNLGLALLATKNTEGAFECLVEAARHYPNNPQVWVRLAECCIKKCCCDEAQKFIVKKLGSGSHTRVLVAKEKEKYSSSGESFAIPSLSLEFAALCLKNAITLLPNQDPPVDVSVPMIQAPPGQAINWKQRCELKNSILVLQSYIFLHLQDPLAALVSANELLSQADASKSHKTWAHIYAAEALIILDKTVEAIEHLQPTMIHELVSGLPDQMRDVIGVAVWAKAAVCNILRGDLLQARKVLQQISSAKVLPLQMYVEICLGNVENCHTILRKIRYTHVSQ
ncbi:CCR4-NOT transcription complex subunit 10 [Zerene cesonia]|uniref:CCR4-NOT transcription complex subunit 10 n=1 Tax=Zerene cesonia TaxID=33412 RepID=UPI0018E59E95|nr:CCR4-NOT transcription complex subunit 10 [Zerene cesonia]